MPSAPPILLPGSTILSGLLLFVLGTLVGSFLNVCIYRLPNGLSVVNPPSRCPNCETRLATRDLLPLISQASLGGMCRYCRAPISWRYFGIEFLTGVLFVLAGWWAGPIGINNWNYNAEGDWPKLLQGLIFMATLVVIFWVDYDTRLIPLEAAFLLGLAGVARDLWETSRGIYTPTTGLTMGGFWPGHELLPSPLPSSLWAMVVVSSILWAMRALFSWIYGREALGFGDVVLVGAIAANLGWNGTLWTFAFASTVLGAGIGLLLQIPRAMRARRWASERASKYLQGLQDEADEAKKLWAKERAKYWQQVAPMLIRHSLRKGMPFGPMLAIGAVAALLWGASLNEAYLKALNPEPATASVQVSVEQGTTASPFSGTPPALPR